MWFRGFSFLSDEELAADLVRATQRFVRIRGAPALADRAEDLHEAVFSASDFGFRQSLIATADINVDRVFV